MNPEVLKIVSDWVAVILQVGSLITLLYALAKFAGTPNRTQNERLESLELWKDEVERRLDSGSHHFDSIDEGNSYILKALLALMDAQISGNNIDELKKQRNNINEYLTDSGRRLKND